MKVTQSLQSGPVDTIQPTNPGNQDALMAIVEQRFEQPMPESAPSCLSMRVCSLSTLSLTPTVQHWCNRLDDMSALLMMGSGPGSAASSSAGCQASEGKESLSTTQTVGWGGTGEGTAVGA